MHRSICKDGHDNSLIADVRMVSVCVMIQDLSHIFRCGSHNFKFKTIYAMHALIMLKIHHNRTIKITGSVWPAAVTNYLPFGIGINSEPHRAHLHKYLHELPVTNGNEAARIVSILS